MLSEPTPVAPHAGDLLRQALSEAGITSRFDGDSASHYVQIPDLDPDGGYFIVCDINSHSSHRADHHAGWAAAYYPADGDGEFTTIYHTGIRDFTADTSAVVTAIKGFLADPTP